jgi:hypothetical protein
VYLLTLVFEIHLPFMAGGTGTWLCHPEGIALAAVE